MDTSDKIIESMRKRYINRVTIPKENLKVIKDRHASIILDDIISKGNKMYKKKGKE